MKCFVSCFKSKKKLFLLFLALSLFLSPSQVLAHSWLECSLICSVTLDSFCMGSSQGQFRPPNVPKSLTYNGHMKYTCVYILLKLITDHCHEQSIMVDTE